MLLEFVTLCCHLSWHFASVCAENVTTFVTLCCHLVAIMWWFYFHHTYCICHMPAYPPACLSNSQVIGCEDCLRNDLYCIGWGVKLFSIQSNVIHPSVCGDVHSKSRTSYSKNQQHMSCRLSTLFINYMVVPLSTHLAVTLRLRRWLSTPILALFCRLSGIHLWRYTL